MVYQKCQMYIYCIHLFISLFKFNYKISFANFCQNLCQRRLEKPRMYKKVNKTDICINLTFVIRILIYQQWLYLCNAQCIMTQMFLCA